MNIQINQINVITIVPAVIAPVMFKRFGCLSLIAGSPAVEFGQAQIAEESVKNFAFF